MKSILLEADAPGAGISRNMAGGLCFSGDGLKCSGIFHISDAAGADAIWLLKKMTSHACQLFLLFVWL